jgi:hypothetical protein
LAPFAYGLLFGAGIDPNAISADKPHYCQISAAWEESERTNGNGRPYKNVTHIQPLPSAAEAETLELLRQLVKQNEEIKNNLRRIGDYARVGRDFAEQAKDLLLYQADQLPGGREALREWYKGQEK